MPSADVLIIEVALRHFVLQKICHECDYYHKKQIVIIIHISARWNCRSRSYI